MYFFQKYSYEFKIDYMIQLKKKVLFYLFV